MKKIIFSLLFLVFIMAGCGLNGERSEISKEIGVNVSEGNEIFSYDDHGGFHGDRTSCIALQFENDKILKAISKNKDWQSFPMDDVMQVLVYGKEGSGPYLTGEKGNALIPEINNGYYRLIDRQVDDGRNILDRESMNFTLMVYDTDNKILYYCEMNT